MQGGGTPPAGDIWSQLFVFVLAAQMISRRFGVREV